MNPPLSRLSQAITQTLSKRESVISSSGLANFKALRAAGNELAKRYDRLEKALMPPREKRLEAINKFKLSHSLNQSEWRLVFAGLADTETSGATSLEDEACFGRVHQEVASRINALTLSRRDWLALCFSYFGYEADKPQQNANWCQLRDDIDKGFDAVRQRMAREREWMIVVDRYRELFTEHAGRHLADQMLSGEIQDLSSLQTIAQIAETSWLWKRIFTVLLSRIFELTDEAFSQRLPDLVALGHLNSHYFNQVLSECLTRYHASKFREQSSPLLKQTALDHWGSPQIRSRQNSWLQYVSQPVCAMVVAWFAKEDLEHFFTLLKGSAEVDRARLFYWLRFANQMTYTRIVMGTDAWSRQSQDFVEFRSKNKGRISHLVGGPSHNNAVVMQIGNYFFVEFSGTGNACYIYKATKAPFNPDKAQLSLSSELKQPYAALKRLSHSPAPHVPTRIGGWMLKFDEELRALGIKVDNIKVDNMGESVPGVPNPHYLSQRHSAQSTLARSRPPTPQVNENDDLLGQLREQLKQVPHYIFDKRSRGGALRVLLERKDAQAIITLNRLGFKATNSNPLMFWRS